MSCCWQLPCSASVGENAPQAVLCTALHREKGVVQMGSEKKTIELLNQALSDELAAIYQYMWHHFHGQGMESPAIRELFKEASMDEMKHAEALAERITLLDRKS